MRAPLLALPLLCTIVHGATLADILTHVRATRDAVAFRASGRLVRVLGDQRTTYNFSMRAQTETGVLKIFCEITDPAAARVRLLLESYPDGHNVILRGHPGDRAPGTVTQEHWGDAMLETDFSYEDLMENQFLWRDQALVEEGTYGARASLTVKSQPGPRDQTHYSSVTTWLDKGIYFPLKEEKTVKSSGAVKEFVFFGLRQVKGVWSASQIECKTRGKQGSTLLIVNRGAENVHLNAKEFDPSLLIKP